MNPSPTPTAHLRKSVPVLCVDPVQEDHATLQKIFESSPWSICPDSSWTLRACSTLTDAWRALRSHHFALVLCECDLKPGTWRELLDLLARLPDPPFLIVTSRVADERLWAEALNLGAYDVLAKPFDHTEVMRAVSMACTHWRARQGAARGMSLLAAGGD
jgi:CheY-like chemotaxis protein